MLMAQIIEDKEGPSNFQSLIHNNYHTFKEKQQQTCVRAVKLWSIG